MMVDYEYHKNFNAYGKYAEAIEAEIEVIQEEADESQFGAGRAIAVICDRHRDLRENEAIDNAVDAVRREVGEELSRVEAIAILAEAYTGWGGD